MAETIDLINHEDANYESIRHAEHRRLAAQRYKRAISNAFKQAGAVSGGENVRVVASFIHPPEPEKIWFEVSMDGEIDEVFIDLPQMDANHVWFRVMPQGEIPNMVKMAENPDPSVWTLFLDSKGDIYDNPQRATDLRFYPGLKGFGEQSTEDIDMEKYARLEMHIHPDAELTDLQTWYYLHQHEVLENGRFQVFFQYDPVTECEVATFHQRRGQVSQLAHNEKDQPIEIIDLTGEDNGCQHRSPEATENQFERDGFIEIFHQSVVDKHGTELVQGMKSNVAPGYELDNIQIDPRLIMDGREAVLPPGEINQVQPVLVPSVYEPAQPTQPAYEQIKPGYETFEEMQPGYEMFEQMQPGYKTFEEMQPGYETIEQMQPGYETFEEMQPGYETLEEMQSDDEPTEQMQPGYETTEQMQPGYEMFEQIQPGYETIEQMQPGYETIEEMQPETFEDMQPGYETIEHMEPGYGTFEEMLSDYEQMQNGYETIEQVQAGDEPAEHLYEQAEPIIELSGDNEINFSKEPLDFENNGFVYDQIEPTVQQGEHAQHGLQQHVNDNQPLRDMTLSDTSNEILDIDFMAMMQEAIRVEDERLGITFGTEQDVNRLNNGIINPCPAVPDKLDPIEPIEDIDLLEETEPGLDYRRGEFGGWN